MELLEFAQAVIEAGGGAAEIDSALDVETLLPDGLAARLGLPLDARLRQAVPNGQDCPDAAFLHHGSALLDRLIAEALGEGRAAAVRAEAALPRAETAEHAALAAMQPLNGAVRLLGSSPGLATYVVIGFHYRALGEERREGLVDVAVDWSGASLAPTLPRLVLQLATELRPVTLAAGSSVPPGVLRAAEGAARERVLGELSPLRRLLASRLERNVSRLHGYFHSMQLELLRSGSRRGLDGPARDQLAARLATIPGELRARIAEARGRMSLRVVLRPVTALLVTMPAQTVRLRLLRRKAEREVTLRYGALQRDCDRLLCEGCWAVALTTPILCDERVHLLCEACAADCPDCRAHTCLACQRRCRRCGRTANLRQATPAQARSVAPPPAPAASPAPASPASAPVPASQASAPVPASVASPPVPASQASVPAPARAASAPAPAPAPAAAVIQLALALADGDPAQRILVVLRRLGETRPEALAASTGLPLEQVRDVIAALRKAGLVTHAGHGRGTRYLLAQPTVSPS